MDRTTLENSTADLVEQVREYVRSQKALWQRVPHLALEADGRTGYSAAYSRAYTQGYWALNSSLRSGYYMVCVDLASGELVSPPNYGETRDAPAPGEHVVALLRDIEELDAAVLVAHLESAAKMPYFSGYDAAAQERWREDKRAQCGVRVVYEGRHVPTAFSRA